MNKKLIAIAVGAALAVPMAAQADVTVYGKAQIQLDNTKTEVGAGGASTSTTVRNLNDSRKMGRIGVNATEDLGNGLTGLAHYGILIPTGEAHPNGSLTMRQSYVGIAGGFGTVRFGRLAGAYKDTNLDPYIATVLEARTFGGNSAGAFAHNGFINDAIKYNNKFGNLKFEALMTAGNSNNTGSGNSVGTTTADNGDFQLAADYRSGPMRVIVAYSKQKNAGLDMVTGLPVNQKLTTVGVQYKIGPGTATAQIESAKNYVLKMPVTVGPLTKGTTYGVGDVKFYMLSYDANLGNMNDLYVRLGQEKYKDAGDMKFKSYALALRHHMSKTFNVFGGYFQSKLDGVPGITLKTTTFALGMRKDF